MYAPMAISLKAYGAELSSAAQQYVDTILANPWVQEWIRQGKAEQQAKVVLSSVSGL
jgi:glutathione S-transferase